MDPTVIIAAMGVPSAITGFFFWLFEKKLEQRYDREKAEQERKERIREEKEAAREKNELYLIKSVSAAIALGEATAKAVQRIPDAKCNGDMHAALDYAQKVKHEQKDFLSEQALHQLY